MRFPLPGGEGRVRGDRDRPRSGWGKQPPSPCPLPLGEGSSVTSIAQIGRAPPHCCALIIPAPCCIMRLALRANECQNPRPTLLHFPLFSGMMD